MFCWVKLFFVSDDFSFSRFPLFPKLNENGHPWKSLAPNSELWKIDIFKKIAYIANSLFRTLISARFSFVSLLQKILYTQKFRVFSKEPKTHLWKQVLILNLKLLQENMYKLYCVPTVHGLSWKSFNYDPKKARLICGSYIEDSSFQPQQNFLSSSNILASNVQNFSFFAQILILFVTWWPRHNTY